LGFAYIVSSLAHGALHCKLPNHYNNTDDTDPMICITQWPWQCWEPLKTLESLLKSLLRMAKTFLAKPQSFFAKQKLKIKLPNCTECQYAECHGATKTTNIQNKIGINQSIFHRLSLILIRHIHSKREMSLRATYY